MPTNKWLKYITFRIESSVRLCLNESSAKGFSNNDGRH